MRGSPAGTRGRGGAAGIDGLVSGELVQGGAPTGLRAFETVSADPRTSGLDRPVGSIVHLSTTRAYLKVGSGTTDWIDLGASVWYEHSGAAVAQVDLTGLDGDSDRLLEWGCIIRGGAVGMDINLQPNGLNTNLQGNINAAFAGAEWRITQTRANATTFARGTLYAKTGAARVGEFTSQSNDGVAAGTSHGWNGQIVWTETTVNLTSLRFLGTSANILTGSLFWARPVLGQVL